jgi:hypothetical protein
MYVYVPKRQELPLSMSDMSFLRFDTFISIGRARAERVECLLARRVRADQRRKGGVGVAFVTGKQRSSYARTMRSFDADNAVEVEPTHGVELGPNNIKGQPLGDEWHGLAAERDPPYLPPSEKACRRCFEN